MNRSMSRNIIVGIGMGLILIGIVWACLKIGSPGELSAASGSKSVSLVKKSSEKSAKGRTPLKKLFSSLQADQKPASDPDSNIPAELPAEFPIDVPEPMSAVPTELPVTELPAAGQAPDPLTDTESLLEPADDDSAFSPNGSSVSKEELSFDLPESEDEPIFLNVAEDKPKALRKSGTDSTAAGNVIPLPGDRFDFDQASADSFVMDELPETSQADSALPEALPERITAPLTKGTPVQTSSAGSAGPAPAKVANRQGGGSAPSAVLLPDALLTSDRIGLARPGDASLEGPQKAELVLTKELPPEIQIGKEASFRIVLKNVGKSSARSVTVRDAVPEGTRFIGSHPEAEPTASGQLIWPPFDMEPDEEKVFECRFVPELEGEIGSQATVFFGAEASGRTRCTRPMLKLAVSAPNESLIGEKVKFDIQISNPGTGTATNVTLLEEVPEGLEHPGGRTLNNLIGDLKPGETKKLSLSLRTAAPGTIANVMAVTADSGLREEAMTEIQVHAPELALEIVGAKERYLEREAVYRLKVWNPGSASAKGVKLVAELPKGMEFIRTNNEGVYQESTHAVYWELVELPEKIAPGEIELVLKPTAAGTGRLVFRGEGDLHLTATTEREVVIDGISALSYRMAALTDTVETGGEALFEITLGNRGTKESTNVNLTVTLPEGMEAVEADGPTRYSLREGRLVFLPIAKIGPKEEMVYKLKTRCGASGDLRVRAEVESDDMEPLMKEESVRVYGN